MKNKHSKDWYFAAASANHLIAFEISSEEAEELSGAPKFSCFTLWVEALIENSDWRDEAFLTVQYGLEKAGLA